MFTPPPRLTAEYKLLPPGTAPQKAQVVALAEKSPPKLIELERIFDFKVPPNLSLD